MPSDLTIALKKISQITMSNKNLTASSSCSIPLTGNLPTKSARTSQPGQPQKPKLHKHRRLRPQANGRKRSSQLFNGQSQPAAPLISRPFHLGCSLRSFNLIICHSNKATEDTPIFFFSPKIVIYLRSSHPQIYQVFV